MTCPRHLEDELQVGIGPIIDAQEVDHAGRGTDGNKTGMGRGPVKRRKWREVIMFGELAIVKATPPRVTCGLVDLDDTMLHVDVEK